MSQNGGGADCGISRTISKNKTPVLRWRMMCEFLYTTGNRCRALLPSQESNKYEWWHIPVTYEKKKVPGKQESTFSGVQ